MFVLTLKDVEIGSVQHPKWPKQIPILSYRDKAFGLLSVFRARQQVEAQASLRDLISNEGRMCVLLEELHRFSLWQPIRIDQKQLCPVVPAAYAKACLLLIQALYGDVEQLLGSQPTEVFRAGFLKHAPVPIQKVGGLGALLKLNPLIETLPVWGEEEICTLLIELHRQGAAFFGRSQFAPRTLSALDILLGNEKSVFLNWLRLSLLGNLWLSSHNSRLYSQK